MKLKITILLIICLTASLASAITGGGRMSGVFASYNVPKPPNAPSVTATAGNTQITYTWSAPATDGTHDPATSYNLRYGTVSGSLGTTVTGVTSPYPLTGLLNGTTYYAKIDAVNAGGTTSSGEVSKTPIGPLVPFYPDFETAGAVASNPTKFLWGDNVVATISSRWDGWWGFQMTDDTVTTSINGVVDRYASAEMTGSYLGRVTASGNANHGYVAGLMTQRSKADIDASTGVITFDIRPKTIPSGIYSYTWIQIHPLDAAGNRLVTTADSRITLWKNSGATAHNGTVLMFTASANTTYSKSFDVKTFLADKYDSGKTWADVSSVEFEFSAYTDSGTAGGASSFYIDNFR